MTGRRTLARRAAAEHRRLLLPLAVIFAANVALYGFVVYPLRERVQNIEQREDAAARELAAARQAYGEATGTLTGKDRAAQELERFYDDVLPADLPAARRLTHARVPALARQHGILYDSATTQPPAPAARGSELLELRTRVELAGRYRDLRAFIHQLETAPEFLVIDEIRLAEEDETLLGLSLQLTTYYRTPAP